MILQTCMHSSKTSASILLHITRVYLFGNFSSCFCSQYIGDEVLALEFGFLEDGGCVDLDRGQNYKNWCQHNSN